MPDPSTHITTADAAQLLSVNVSRIKAMIAAGQLSAERFSGVWLISRASVDAEIARRAADPTATRPGRRKGCAK